MTQTDRVLVLYHYWRSSSSWRVRWALAIKGIAYEAVPIDLLKGEQRSEEHLLRNPLGAVPVLDVEGIYIAESVAILEYLEETHPSPPLLPAAPRDRARVRQLVQIIVADTQPMQNISVLQQVERFAGTAEGRRAWAQYHITRGFDAYEALLDLPDRPPGPYSHGQSLTMADLCLIPQCGNAKRQDMDLERWPHIAAIDAACQHLESMLQGQPSAFKPT